MAWTDPSCAENHINGENLMEMDQSHLKDMGIKKVGDRVRIGSQAKQLRNKEFKKASKRVSNRVCSDPLPSAYTSNVIAAIARRLGQLRLHPPVVCISTTTPGHTSRTR